MLNKLLEGRVRQLRPAYKEVPARDAESKFTLPLELQQGGLRLAHETEDGGGLSTWSGSLWWAKMDSAHRLQ